MRLVVDASVLIGEVLRGAGRERLSDPRLELSLPEHVWGAVQHELPRRIAAFAHHRDIPETQATALLGRCLDAVRANVSIVDGAVTAPLESETRARSLRDPRHWALVACALALGSGIWTVDNDLLGTGVATWTTDTLIGWLARHA